MVITIAIASECEDTRKTIRKLLAKQDDFRITSIGKDAGDVIISAKSHQPDIIIMDLKMGDYNSLDLAPIIQRNSPSTALIVLCPDDAENDVAQALKAGISGYLLGQEVFENLAFSVRSVFYGGLYISESVKNDALSCFSVPEGAIPIRTAMKDSFSPTELGIFYGIVHGYSDKEIARTLNMNVGSVRNCVARIKKKAGLNSRLQMTAYALLSGMISIKKIGDVFFPMDN